MRDFFRGWKLKAVCVTLLIACVFATGWLRSRTLCELICLRSGSHRFDQIGWEDGYFVWNIDALDDFVKESIEHAAWDIFSEEGSFGLLNEPQVKWTWTWWGVGVGLLDSTEFVGGRRSVYRFIPFWLMAPPLTVISAWLLLSKWRTKSEQPFTSTGEKP